MGVIVRLLPVAARESRVAFVERCLPSRVGWQLLKGVFRVGWQRGRRGIEIAAAPGLSHDTQLTHVVYFTEFFPRTPRLMEGRLEIRVHASSPWHGLATRSSTAAASGM